MPLASIRKELIWANFHLLHLHITIDYVLLWASKKVDTIDKSSFSIEFTVFNFKDSSIQGTAVSPSNTGN
jgi:hypothetical protein